MPETFAGFFCDKVRSLSEQAVVSGNVYNGKRKVNCNDKMFMSMDDITECVRSIKINVCEVAQILFLVTKVNAIIGITFFFLA